MTRVLLTDLLDMNELGEMISQKYIRVQAHPLLPLSIYNYTEQAQFDRAWNNATRLCRGLIVHLAEDAPVVVARPFAKFFNHGEPEAPVLDLDAPAYVSDKMDGSLGILYPTGNGGWCIATRGSFISEQANRATLILRERYMSFRPQEGITPLFEIVYPQNRIVLDYGDAEDLYLLGGVDIATGTVFPPDVIHGWPGPSAEVMQASSLKEALALPVRENREGIVVRSGYDMVKIKQADYVALHRVLTTTSSRNIWEYLAVNASKHLIREQKDWTRLGIGPERARGIAEAGPDWLDKMLAAVPDEFYSWVRKTIDELIEETDGIRAEAEQVFAELNGRHEGDRKGFALEAKEHCMSGLLFQLLDGRDITIPVWKMAYPPAMKPWGQRSEDIA